MASIDRVLLVGSNSFVGKRVSSGLRGYDIVGAYHRKPSGLLKRELEMDLTNKDRVEEVVKNSLPSVVVVLAGISSSTESQEILYKVNREGTKNIVLALKNFAPDAYTVFFSTDQVFDGVRGDYKETDVPNPVNDYGRSKLEAELFVRSLNNHLIIRSSLIVGPRYPDDHENFVSKFLSQVGMAVFSDAYRSPLYVGDFERIMPELIKKRVKGTLHVAGNETLSFADMARRIENVFGVKQNCLVEKCSIKSVQKNGGLNNSRLREMLDFSLTSFDEVLRIMKTGGVVCGH